MSRAFLFPVLGALALVAGCATVPDAERAAACASTDWHRYGVNDGTLGVPASERTERFTDCAELGRPADIAAYEQGRAEGLRQFCTAEHGYEIGYAGRRYRDVCPAELEPDFLQGYRQGRDDRPGYGVYPGIGIGIGSGGVRTGIGIGIGAGGWGYDPHWRGHYWRDPFPSSWRRRGAFGCSYWPAAGCW